MTPATNEVENAAAASPSWSSFSWRAWFRLLSNKMRECPVALLNAFLTSSKACGEQLDNLRCLLMVESIGKILCVGNETREKKEEKRDVKDRQGGSGLCH
jgi:hypothetical protein